MQSIHFMLLLLITFSVFCNGLKKEKAKKKGKQLNDDPLKLILDQNNWKELASKFISDVASNIDMNKVMKMVKNFNVTSFLKDLQKKEL